MVAKIVQWKAFPGLLVATWLFWACTPGKAQEQKASDDNEVLERLWNLSGQEYVETRDQFLCRGSNSFDIPGALEKSWKAGLMAYILSERQSKPAEFAKWDKMKVEVRPSRLRDMYVHPAVDEEGCDAFLVEFHFRIHPLPSENAERAWFAYPTKGISGPSSIWRSILSDQAVKHKGLYLLAARGIGYCGHEEADRQAIVAYLRENWPSNASEHRIFKELLAGLQLNPTPDFAIGILTESRACWSGHAESAIMVCMSLSKCSGTAPPELVSTLESLLLGEDAVLSVSVAQALGAVGGTWRTVEILREAAVNAKHEGDAKIFRETAQKVKEHLMNGESPNPGQGKKNGVVPDGQSYGQPRGNEVGEQGSPVAPDGKATGGARSLVWVLAGGGLLGLVLMVGLFLALCRRSSGRNADSVRE